MHEVLVNRLGGLSLPRKSVVRLTDRPDMILDVYRGRKTTKQQSNNLQIKLKLHLLLFYPSTWYICDFFLFHIEIEGKCGWIIGGGGGGGGGANGGLVPLPAPPPPPLPTPMI